MPANDLPPPAPKEAAPLVKVTVAPAPMVSDESVWLTVPNLNVVPAPVTLTAEVPLPTAPSTVVVPAVALSAA